MTTQADMTMAPSVTLTAVVSKREIKLDAIGAPAVLLFVSRETQDQVDPIRDAVRERFPEASDVVIANIADVRGIPRLVRKVAEQIMKKSYDEHAKKLEPGKDPQDYVIVLPDWDGAAFSALGIDDVKEQIAAVVLARDGRVLGRCQGGDVAGDVMRLLDAATA